MIICFLGVRPYTRSGTICSRQGRHTIQHLKLAICKSVTKQLSLETIFYRFPQKTKGKKELPFKQDSCFSRPLFQVLASTTTAEPRRLRSVRAHPPAGGRPRFSVLRAGALASLLPQAQAWIRFLSNGLPLATGGRGALGRLSRAFPHRLTVEGAGRTMSEILCQWLNQEVKVSQTVSE